MDASQLYKLGKLTEAIDAQVAVVKARPIDANARLFLFELLVFAGDLDRAQRQIDALRYDDPEIEASVVNYRNLLAAERCRRQVLAGKLQPEFISPTPEHVKLRILGVSKLAEGALADAAQIFHQANDQAPQIKGSLNDEPFDSLRDSDDCLGSVLEVFAQGRYLWMPLEQVKTLTMKAPRFPRDIFWIPAQLELRQGDAGAVFLPALYVDSAQEDDPHLKLGRLTDWRGDALVRGVGQKTFLVGSAESGILDWRKLQMD